MSGGNVQYLTVPGLEALKKEYERVKRVTIPEIAVRIDEAKQLGDLSENAEYHQAKDDMAWAHGRLLELQYVLDSATLVEDIKRDDGAISVGSTVTVKVKENVKAYTIVGSQEASPADGRISNESPLGQAFLGKKVGDKVEVRAPAGIQIYEIIAVK